MRVFLAYISMILLWATTPLAIKLSVEGFGVIWSATSRMAIGFICMVFICVLVRKRLTFSRTAVFTYAAVALQIYGAMSVVYWAAQFIPSLSLIHISEPTRRS